MKLLQYPFIQGILNELPREEMLWLVFPDRHMALLATRRASMIISRVRLIAAMLAVLTTLFIIPDLLVLPWPLSGNLAIGRIVASLAFAALACSFNGSTRMRDAYLALAMLFTISTVFYIASYALLAQHNLNGVSAIIEATYAFLPLIMVAGLSMFPLTALEGAIFAAPVLVAEIISTLSNLDIMNLSPLISTAWLAILIAIVATLSGMSQLGFMIALVRMAIRDALTSCFSRMSGMELLEIQFIIATRSSNPLSVAFIDLDNFKEVNDKFGHEAGDQVLIMAAERIRATLRTGDMLVRWGGEEFIVIMPNTYCNDAVSGMDRLRAGGLGVRLDGKPITASIGLAERIDDQASNWKTLVEIADQRMYKAKQLGKNRVESFCTRDTSPAVAGGAI